MISDFCIAQDVEPNYAILRYEVAVDLDVFTDLDKRKLVRSKEKSLYTKIIAEQLGRYRTGTFPFFVSQLGTVDSLEMADKDALAEKVKFDEGVPIPFLPKRTLKKKCQEVPYDFFLITNVEVAKPIIKLASNLLTIKTTIKVLNKAGDLVHSEKFDMKLDKPIRSRDFEGGFDKVYRTHYDKLYEKLVPYIETAVTDALEKFDFPSS